MTVFIVSMHVISNMLNTRIACFFFIINVQFMLRKVVVSQILCKIKLHDHIYVIKINKIKNLP